MIERHEENFEVVAINNTYEPALIRFLFWKGVDPGEFQASFGVGGDVYEEEVIGGFDGFRLFDKYYFGQVKEGEWGEFLGEGVLYLASQRENAGGDWDWRESAPGGTKVLETVTAPTGEPLFFLVMILRLPTTATLTISNRRPSSGSCGGVTISAPTASCPMSAGLKYPVPPKRLSSKPKN